MEYPPDTGVESSKNWPSEAAVKLDYVESGVSDAASLDRDTACLCQRPLAREVMKVCYSPELCHSEAWSRENVKYVAIQKCPEIDKRSMRVKKERRLCLLRH